MFVAQELRKKNIAEYLLYMWQVEDTIRAFDCSLRRIRDEWVSRFDYTDEQKEEELDWFGNLIRMMNQEGCREKGHLQINKVTMQMLIELHDQLLQSTKFPFYNAEYYKVLPFIVELRNRGRDLFQFTLRCDAPALAEEGHLARYSACREGNHHLHRDAQRLL